jgi:hypothetical protein
MIASPGVKTRFNENLEITAKLKIMSEVANFITQILELLACGRSSIVKTLNRCNFWNVHFLVFRIPGDRQRPESE